MKRIVIYGNSGSGKSTLAGCYAMNPDVEHLDLDSIAWESAGVRRRVSDSIKDLKAFMASHDSWVIEGCYGSLVKEAADSATELIFLNPGIEDCQGNCRSRPWEQHKYNTKEDQDKNLGMLLGWVAEYETRTDEFSLQVHKGIFDSFVGTKHELKSNSETQSKTEEAAASSGTSL